MGSVADDRWHVRMAAGEVKVLTLEQIDDLFRIEIIDGDTLVRQDGTEQWLPLRVVAGLDDEASEPAAAAPAPAVRSAPPPPVRSAPPPPVRSAPPPSVRSAPPPPPAPLPAPTTAPFTHSPSFVPPPAMARSMPPSAPPPPVAPPIIPRPAPLPFTPPAVLPRASRVEPLLIGLAALLGVVLTLQRNGVVATLAASAGQTAAYIKLEKALGGPAPGTPRAVEALVNTTRSR